VRETTIEEEKEELEKKVAKKGDFWFQNPCVKCSILCNHIIWSLIMWGGESLSFLLGFWEELRKMWNCLWSCLINIWWLFISVNHKKLSKL